MSARRARRIARTAWSRPFVAIRRRPSRRNCSPRAPRPMAKRNRRGWPRSPARRFRRLLLLGNRARVRQLRDDVAVAVRLDVTANLAAELDLELAVADRSGYLPAGADQQALADHQIALERAAHVGTVDLGSALEDAAFR